MTPAQKAAETKKRQYEEGTPHQKAWITRRRKEAARKAWETRRMLVKT